MIKNKYYEYKSWSLFWGMFSNQKKEIQQTIDYHNAAGWKVVQFEWRTSKTSLFIGILVLILTMLTLGFMNYWAGFSIIFEKED